MEVEYKQGLKKLDKAFEIWKKFLNEEIASELEKIGREFERNARAFNEPDVTGAQDDALVSTRAVISKSEKGPGDYISVALYGSPEGDVDAAIKFNFLEYHIGNERGQFYTPAWTLAKNKLKRVVTNANRRATTKSARYFAE